MENMLKNMTPKQIVSELDKYIIGQDKAKRSVAVALRNRYRRNQLSEEMKEEITPKNILMMGPRSQDVLPSLWTRLSSRSRPPSSLKSVPSAATWNP